MSLPKTITKYVNGYTLFFYIEKRGEYHHLTLLQTRQETGEQTFIQSRNGYKDPREARKMQYAISQVYEPE